MLTLAVFAAIAGGTLVSEDLTAVTVGLAVRDGSLPAMGGVAAVALGIYAGDVGLWALGRFASTWSPVARLFERASGGRLALASDLIERHAAALLLSSRVVPGTRLPLYVAAGASRRATVRVLSWMAVAVVLWTPFIVLGTAWLGPVVAGPVSHASSAAWIARTAVALSVIGALRIAVPLSTAAGRHRTSVAFARARHWEFWPAWLLNAPVLAWIACLAVRHRSLAVVTAANPGIPDGGLVGESKAGILAGVPTPWVQPWAVVPSGTIDERRAAARRIVDAGAWEFPLVAKPDVGQRGVGVRWLTDEAALSAYLQREVGPVVLQVAHPGPFEAGIFYVRHPHEAHGRIWSITDKRFPAVTGDGRSTLGALLASHARHRLQAAVFRARLAGSLDCVPAAGETVRLGRAGNHCQGTQFLDGAHLWTPTLEARVDEIARAMPGFHFGRFDVRYRDRDAFMAGTDLAVIEVNGITSEATHVYDPRYTVWHAWRTLSRQWSLAFAIGAANRDLGFHPAPARRIAAVIWRFLRSAPSQPVSD